jgi:predicted dehydrogenase
MLRVALIGCGKIADEHVSAIRRVPGCGIVGVCDREPLMAQQLSERFGIEPRFVDPATLIDQAQPHVVHITTPPESHFDLARRCLERGCHVYVEKPFTLFEKDARALIAQAERQGLRITVGHDAQFGHAMCRMRALVRSGYLGDGPLHIESHYGYELGDGYARSLLADGNHWVRRLPGLLLQNVISHGIATVAEFLDGSSPRVIAHGFTSPFLRRLGETDIVDELRVIIADEDRATAYFTFSSQLRPALHECRIFGSTNGLVVDQDRETVLALRGARYPSHADRFVPPLSMARQNVSNVMGNARRFLRRDFHMKSGMTHLIEAFYRSIVDGGPPPIPAREILLTASIMETIFGQLALRHAAGIEGRRALASS